MNEIKIDKNIPIPIGVAGNRGPIREAVSKMEVGDSFEIERTPTNRSVAIQAAAHFGFKIKTKKDADDSSKLRIWRFQ